MSSVLAIIRWSLAWSVELGFLSTTHGTSTAPPAACAATRSSTSPVRRSVRGRRGRRRRLPRAIWRGYRMLISRRSLIAGLLAMVAIVGTAGCGDLPSTGAGAGKTGNGKIVLDFWNGFTGPDGKTMQGIVTQFQKDNPDIIVHTQIIPWGTYYDKLTLSLAYGGAPDVYIVHASRLPEFASFGKLHRVGDMLATDNQTLKSTDIAKMH